MSLSRSLDEHDDNAIVVNPAAIDDDRNEAVLDANDVEKMLDGIGLHPTAQNAAKVVEE